MKKFPKPWYRPARGVWYVTLDGQQVNLGPDKDQAFDRYKKLLTTPKQQRQVTSESLAAIADAFLEWVQRHRSPDTYAWYQYRLQRFVRRHPNLRAAEVRPFHVQQWVDSYTLSVTSRRNYLRAVKRCLAWATRQGYLDKNPVDGLEIPSAERREIFLTQADFDQLLAAVKDEAFRDLLIVTWETGCRPQESLRAEGRHVDFRNQRLVFPKSESKNKRIGRVVYLTDKAMSIVKRLYEKHPTGKLFRNAGGAAWTTSAINCAFTRVRIRLGMRRMKERGLKVSDEAVAQFLPRLKQQHRRGGETVAKTPAELRHEARRKMTYRLACTLAPKWSLYALRHSWATSALQRGVDPLTVAILMGHSDPSMLSKVYQHVALDPQHMLQAAKRAVG